MAYSTTGSLGEITDNYFRKCEMSIGSYYQNDALQMRCNNFFQCSYDIVLGIHNSSIGSFQGSNRNPAGNDFSNPCQSSINNIYTWGGADHFSYFYNTFDLSENPYCDDGANYSKYPSSFNPSGCPNPIIINPCNTKSCLIAAWNRLNNLKTPLDKGANPQIEIEVKTAPNSAETYEIIDDAGAFLSENNLSVIADSPEFALWKKERILIKNAPLSDEIMASIEGNISNFAYKRLNRIKQRVPVSKREILKAKVSIKETKLNYTLVKLIENALLADDLETIEDITEVIDNYYSSKQLYGAYLEEGNVSEAQILLNGLEENSSDKQNFKNIQEIYLAYRINQDDFELDDEQNNFLLTLAEENSILSGYAISLLYQLTDYNIEFEFPDFPEASGKRANQFKSNPEILQEHLLVYPNPTQNYVTVSIAQKGFTDLNLTDLNGKVLKSMRINNATNKIQLDVSDYKNGIYFICLTNTEGEKLTTKLILLK